ncbi:MULTISPECIES: low temperature requirement protein A [unclassified Streptomyces]|uniref:low temperature requirement protein A n=1 Tax=unclassified Streptomyces TaxID=2593676 RepID=UPI002481E7FD|nr:MULTISPECIES: low temperature requirement protein A [unclassified Streptomyces]MDA5285466.1 low temperature requirement protein A [Streptomyces sp. Isolate_45]MDX2390448.1 low temperature requirement protein A [Streptomyces sp. DK15]
MTESVAPVANEPAERHASWLELFFDLTAVAGVAQLAHLLHGGPGWADLALYTVMFLAFWTGWMLFTVYGNVTGEQAGTRTVLAGMFGMAVMAASVHGVREDKAWAFALAYIVVRSLAGKAWGRRGEYVADLPITQVGLGLTPWIVSMWCDGTVRYALWALGLAIDLVVMFTVSAQRVTARVEQQYAAAGARGERKRPVPRAALTDAPHLGERLGLFVLIVLGEAIAQMVAAASVAEWDWALCGVGVGAFVLLLQLWSLSLRHGADGIPLLAVDALPLRMALPLHCFVAGSVAAFAAAAGDAVAYADGPVPDAVRWLMCATLGVYLLIAGSAAACSGRGAARTALLVGPALVLVAVLCAVAGGWGPVALVWTLVLAVRWPLLVERLRPSPPPARVAP